MQPGRWDRPHEHHGCSCDLSYKSPEQIALMRGDAGVWIRPKRRRRIPWFAVVLLILFAAVVAVCPFTMYGCSIPPERSGPFAIIEPAQNVGTSEQVPTLCAWTDRKAAELSLRYGVSAPITTFRDEPCPVAGEVAIHGIAIVRSYLYGHYAIINRHIEVWLKGPFGSPLPLDDVKRTWLHEWLHHYDAEVGNFPPLGSHNEEFERRIDLMRLEE